MSQPTELDRLRVLVDAGITLSSEFSLDERKRSAVPDGQKDREQLLGRRVDAEPRGLRDPAIR
jgi:hypothetical protein